MARGPDFALAKHIATSLSLAFVQDVIDASGDPETAVVFAGEEPIRPEDAIVVIPGIGGRIPNRVSEEHILEVRVRDRDYQVAYERALAIHNLLFDPDDTAQGILGGIAMRVRPNAPPVSLGRDDGPGPGRQRFSQTFTALLKAGDNTTA